MNTATDVANHLDQREARLKADLEQLAQERREQECLLVQMPDAWWDARYEVAPHLVHELYSDPSQTRALVQLRFADENGLAQMISCIEELRGLGEANVDSDYVYALAHQLLAMEADELINVSFDDHVTVTLLHVDYADGRLSTREGSQYTALWATARAAGAVLASDYPMSQ